MAATVHTSVLVRDVSKIVADIIVNDPLFRTPDKDLESLASSAPFQRALGKALAQRIDWENVRYRRAHPKHGRKAASV